MMTSLPGRSSAGALSGVWFFEDPVPVRKNEVSRDGDAPTLVAFREEGEEHLHLIAVVLDVADVVQKDALVAVQLGQHGWQAEVALGRQQFLNERGGWRPQHRMPLQDQLVADRRQR